MDKTPSPPRFLACFDARRLSHVFTDVLVIGSGAAGLRAAIEASASCEVIVAVKRSVSDNNTVYAQGGIAAALGMDDSPSSHAEDTIASGRDLCDADVVGSVTSEAPERVMELASWGAAFDRDGEALALAMEGGHSHARLARAGGDATGAEIHATLLKKARGMPSLVFMEDAFAVDLLTVEGRCMGALFKVRSKGLTVVRANAVIIATGGAGRLFRETTNPPGACGDGLAAAHRAGARLRDLEFVQFHPTALYLAGAPRFLISEAARGEGGVLLDVSGRRFMPEFHEKAELAPRDVVSRSINEVIKRTAASCVFLDLRHLPPGTARARFPGIAAQLDGFGLDLGSDLIPVRPSAHYMIGGVITDPEGRTSLHGLFAAGEAASTGLHGANRLGSNSLMEAMVFGRRAGEAAARIAGENRSPKRPLSVASPDQTRLRNQGDIHFDDLENSLQSLMWRNVGLERSESSLVEALEKIAFWSGYVMPRRFRSVRGIQMQNMLQAARLVALGALRRRESRGGHFRLDYPVESPDWRRSNEADPA